MTTPQQVQAPDVDQRRPIGHANYNGNTVPYITRVIGAGRAMGPNYMGEQMFPVTAQFDPDTNTSRVGFSLMAPTYTSEPGRSS